MTKLCSPKFSETVQDIISTIITYWHYFLPCVAVVMVIVAYLIYKGFLNKITIFGLEIVPYNKHGHPKKLKNKNLVFKHRDATEFNSYFEKLSYQAERIVSISMGFTILDRSSFFLDLIDRTSEGKCNLEIYLANPFSPAIETRLIEEEIGKEIKPPIGKSGMINHIDTILKKQKEKKLYSAPNFSFKLFSDYPTFALLIVDDVYLSYSYGCTRLGNFSPVVCYKKNNPDHKPMIEFFEEQYKCIKRLAVDAQFIYDLYMGNDVQKEDLSSFAVYFVPEATSALYEFGIDVLGYDMRKNYRGKSKWSSYAGEAYNFGFHLTIADALYFFHQHEIDLLSKEIELLAQEFKSFRLTFKIQAGFPNERSISLVCQDDSGTLEALHHELVFRCYRRAVASNYSLGIAKLDRDKNETRSKLMIQRYHAPYILKQFQPHFTLLTEVPVDQMKQIAQEVEDLFKQKVPESHIDITSLAFMTQPKSNSNNPWQIKDEIKLKLR
ncbi:MAG: DUF1045 domain-containing protein [bacterium]